MVLNGFELLESVDEQEQTILAVASGGLGREAFVQWLASRMRPVDEPA
jgi:death on curing protein